MSQSSRLLAGQCWCGGDCPEGGFVVDANVADHPLMFRVGPLGMALWFAAMSYSHRERTSGFIPREVARDDLIMLMFIGELRSGKQTWMGLSASFGMGGFHVDTDYVVEQLVENEVWFTARGGYQLAPLPAADAVPHLPEELR